MIKFQNLLTAIALGTMSNLAAVAGWSPNPDVNLLVSGENAVGQDLVLTAPGPAGGTYISWLSWEQQNSFLKLQLIDKEGNAVWEEGGIYVSTNPTPTWSSGFDVCSDAEGNALIVFPDSRNDSWHAYVYKVSPSGEMLWGDGIALTSDSKESCLNPKLITTDEGNIIVGFQSLIGSRNTLKFSKLSSKGSKLWGGMITVTGTNGLFNLVSSTEDTFFVDYILGNTGEVAVMRYTANGEEAWGEPAIIDNGMAVVSTEPVACSDSKGGIIVGWRYAPSAFEVAGALQAVDRQGNLRWHEFESCPNIPQVAADKDGNIYTAYTYGTSSDINNLFVSKYSADGKLLWETDPLVNCMSSQISIYGVAAVDSNAAVVYRNAVTYNQATVEYAYIESDGKIVKTDAELSTMEGDKGHGSLSLSGNDNLVVAWADNGISKGGGRIYAQKVDLPAGSGISEISVDRTSAVGYNNGILYAPSFNGMVSVYDCSGQLVKRGIVTDGYMEIGQLLQGVYLVSDGKKSDKLFVKR